MRLLHIITGLKTGGAETMLARLVSGHDRSRFEPAVVSLTDEGPIGAQLRAMGLPVWTLGMGRDPLAIPRLVRLVRRYAPGVVQTWLYHANVLGGVAGRLAGAPVVWGLHNVHLAHARHTTAWMARGGAALSRALPARIVCCAEGVRQAHLAMGYAAEPMVVIPNGFDLEAFRPDPQARASVRRELALADSARLIGVVARFDPHKDHQTLIEAAGRLAQQRADAHFLLCGEGITWENERLSGWIRAAGLGERFHLLGPREDVPRLQASLDLGALSSVSEGFPLSIGEAMACEVPCVVTDVGDAAAIVGTAGRVVPARSPAALADAWEELLGLPPEAKAQLGREARQWVEARFGLPSVAARYECLYDAVAAESGISGC